MRMSGAGIIVECLREQGVDTIFGYPGGTVLPLYDALAGSPVRHILTVHEQGAIHAADGYARASGRVGVCLATSGPGATNLVTGLAAAFMDSVPLVALTGQVPTSLIGSDAFQEIDIVGITMPITKHNFLVKDAAKLADTIRCAFRIARSGRPGPVLVDLPRDIQTAEAYFESEPPPAERLSQPPERDSPALGHAVHKLREAERPVIIVGGGAVSAEAQAEIKHLAEKLTAPVVSTLMGLGAFPSSHPLALGLTGLHGHKPANEALFEADIIVAVGSRFSDRVTGDRTRFAADKTIIHIDVDPAEIAKNIAACIGVTGDLRAIVGEIAEALPSRKRAKWWSHNPPPAEEPEQGPLDAPWLFRQIAAQTAGRDCIFTTDVGQHQIWAAQHLALETPRSWLTSGGLGAMGFGLPAAIGAQVAMPRRRVVHIAGDGGFKMTGTELYTIASNRLPIISIIVDNSGLGMIRQLQHVFFNQRYVACRLPPLADFTAFAAAFGIAAEVAETRQAFAAAFAKALAAPQPMVIVARVPPEDMVTPMVKPEAAINVYLDL